MTDLLIAGLAVMLWTVLVWLIGVATGMRFERIECNKKVSDSRRACRRLQQQINEMKKEQP